MFVVRLTRTFSPSHNPHSSQSSCETFILSRDCVRAFRAREIGNLIRKYSVDSRFRRFWSPGVDIVDVVECQTQWRFVKKCYFLLNISQHERELCVLCADDYGSLGSLLGKWGWNFFVCTLFNSNSRTKFHWQKKIRIKAIWRLRGIVWSFWYEISQSSHHRSLSSQQKRNQEKFFTRFHVNESLAQKKSRIILPGEFWVAFVLAQIYSISRLDETSQRRPMLRIWRIKVDKLFKIPSNLIE